MNEIITRLNEIEQKADAILRAAEEQKGRMALQFEQDKHAIDAKYEQLEEEATQRLSSRLEAEADTRMERMREESRAALEKLEFLFAEREEVLAQEIMDRVTQ
ncbi:MAG: hypothetical protein ACLT3H_00395 [Roseburia sp.]